LAQASTTLCIESTAALIQAFNDMDGSRTDDTTLKLHTGTFALGSDLHLDYRGNGGDPQGNYGRLVISGGYNDGCTSQSGALGATTINGSGGQRTIDIETVSNALSLDHLSSNDIDWAFSDWICYQAQERPLNISSVRFLDTRVTFSYMGCYDILVQNSLFTSRADAPNDAAIGYVHNFGTDTHPPFFTMSTSTVRGGSLDLQFLPFDDSQHPDPASVQLTSNVFENDGTEVVINGGNLYASHNRYDSLTLSRGVLATDLDNISATPLLQSSGVPQNGSPVVNAGTRFVPGGLTLKDLANNPRLVGDDPDMGAFETSVDNSFYLDVTNTNVSGTGSLAQAVASANGTNGRQVIRFNIPGTCPRTIVLDHTLTLTDDTDILGDTQPGAQANTWPIGYNGAPCVILKAGAGVTDGLVFDSSESTDDLKLDLIAFSGFGSEALKLRSGRGHLITGNQFGGTIGATPLLDVGIAIVIEQSAGDTQIGGPDAAQANLIGNANVGILLNGSGDNDIIGNAIGETYQDSLPNGIGVLIGSDHNRIEDNWIANSTSLGVLFSTASANYNTFRDNLVSQSDSSGVVINDGAHHNRIGPDNYFGSNGGDGVRVVSGSHSDLSGNNFSNNDGLAIDLGGDGVDTNDVDPIVDGNTTANRHQNYPELTRAIPVPGLAFFNLEGSLSSTVGNYRMDIYRNTTCDASGHGEGASLLGSTSIALDCTILPANNQCRRTFDIFVAGTVTPGSFITTTVTSPGNHTSEFSACRVVTTSDTIFADGFD
ncbi:MAG: NosD domain-containing protein, partial [Dokdonella sp.]